RSARSVTINNQYARPGAPYTASPFQATRSTGSLHRLGVLRVVQASQRELLQVDHAAAERRSLRGDQEQHGIRDLGRLHDPAEREPPAFLVEEVVGMAELLHHGPLALGV